MKSRLVLIAVLLLSFAGVGSTANQQPLKVFILVGQSNMQGHAHVRTLGHIGMDTKTAPMLREIQDASGKPKVARDVWISYLSSNGVKQGRLTTGYGASNEKIGPELTFGIYAQKLLGEPILIIKTAWGGKSLHTDFRPPSAGPYVFNEEQLANFKKRKQDLNQVKAAKQQATGHYYRLMMAHVKKVLADVKSAHPNHDAAAGHELAGLVWFQGWNDMVDGGVYPDRYQKGGYENYSRLLAQFIHDVRQDLKAPKLPFVIGVMGAGGPVADYLPRQKRYAGVHQYFRDAMAAPAALAEFKGNVATVLTEKYWDPELTRLRAREANVRDELKRLQKEKKLNRNQSRAELEELRSKEFNARELKVLEKGVSNAEYHYLGSAKIMAGIGRGFAEAVVSLNRR